MILTKEIPLVFNAINSNFSEREPKHMIEERRIERGNASGTKAADAKNNNSRITYHSRPFPTRSSIYFQRNCISRIKSTIKNVATKGPIKENTVKEKSFFIRTNFLLSKTD